MFSQSSIFLLLLKKEKLNDNDGRNNDDQLSDGNDNNARENMDVENVIIKNFNLCETRQSSSFHHWLNYLFNFVFIFYRKGKFTKIKPMTKV